MSEMTTEQMQEEIRKLKLQVKSLDGQLSAAMYGLLNASAAVSKAAHEVEMLIEQAG